MKFGGAALGNPRNVVKITRIINDYAKQYDLVIVVSAVKEVTDKLYKIAEIIKNRDIDDTLRAIQDIYHLHLAFLKQIKNPVIKLQGQQEIKLLFDLLILFVKKINKENITNSQIDFIVSFGERLSARIVVCYLEMLDRNSLVIDTRDYLMTTKNFGQAKVIVPKSKKTLQTIINQCLTVHAIPVITGYIGHAEDGCITTLGRGGSDYTASLIASFLKANGIILWKDVNGLYDSDPKKYKKARLMVKANYDDFLKLSKSGAKIIHPYAIVPLKNPHIPLHIKSFLKPKQKGTLIWKGTTQYA